MGKNAMKSEELYEINFIENKLITYTIKVI